MKIKLLASILGSFLLYTSLVHADTFVKAGATSRCVDIKILDSTKTDGSGLTGLAFNSAGLTCSYHRNTANSAVTITLASTTLGSYTSGGFVEVDAAKNPGIYSVCPPNAAFAASANEVAISCTGATNAAQADLRVIIGADVNIASANTASIPEAAFAPTNTFGTGSTTTVLQLNAGETANDITGQGICATSGGMSPSCRTISSYNTSTRQATISPAVTTAPISGDGYAIGGSLYSANPGAAPTVSQIVNGVYDELRSLHTTSGTFGQGVSSVQGNVTGSVGSVAGSVTGSVASVTGNVSGSVGSVAAGGITAASYGADVVGHVGTAQSVTSTTIRFAAGDVYSTSDQLNDMFSVLITSASTGRWQFQCVCGFSNSTNTATLCGKWKTTPTGTVKYAVLPTANCNLAKYPLNH